MPWFVSIIIALTAACWWEYRRHFHGTRFRERAVEFVLIIFVALVLWWVYLTQVGG